MKTQFTIAYRCVQCGKIEFRHISIFELSGKKSLKINCPCCDYAALVIQTKDYKNFMINIECVICNVPHIYYFSLREIYNNDEPIVLCCTDYELELCFVGEKNSVEKTVDKYEQDLEEFINELGYDDYFVNSEIMMECINILHDLAEKEDIICECGKSDVGITLLSDSIELRCQHCRSAYIIPAENRKDVENLLNINTIFIEKNNSIAPWDSLHMDPKR
jgi:DNA-directed RNA polymerase subunit RPC12/RpoP